MIVFLTLCYCGILALFVKLGIIRLTLFWKLSPVFWMLLLLIVLFIPMQWGAPSGAVTSIQTIVEIIPNVAGEVIEVPVKGLTPLKQGDVLFRIDPVPFQAEVDRVKAALAAAEQNVPQLKAVAENAAAVLEQNIAERDLAKLNYDRAVSLRTDNVGAIAMIEVDQTRQTLAAADARVRAAEASKQQADLAYRSEIDGVNTRVAELKAELARVEFDLRQTVVRAPCDGYVIGVTLRPGQRVANLPLRSWMSFVNTEQPTLFVGVPQYVQRYVEPGQEVEVTLKMFPGRILKAQVDEVAYMTPEGQVPASGLVPAAPTRSQTASPFGVRLKLNEDEAVDDHHLPGGAVGTGAIYTQVVQPTHVIRRVMIRMQAWINYVIP